jgi:hypothetical protein
MGSPFTMDKGVDSIEVGQNESHPLILGPEYPEKTYPLSLFAVTNPSILFRFGGPDLRTG